MPLLTTSAFDLSRRRLQPEMMDQPGLDPAEHAAALRGLGRINFLSRSGATLFKAVATIARERPGKPIRVLDVASGGGDVALTIAKRARKAGLDVRSEGCDISPRAVEFAQSEADKQGLPARFFVCDALNGSLPDGYDIITSTLFLHHLDDLEAIGLMRSMSEAAGQAVLIDDLLRCRLGYNLAWVGCHLLSTSIVVRHDGPISVEAAYSADEVAGLAQEAGLESATLSRHWPQRFLLSWRRP